MWRNTAERYGSLQIALHWLMLVLLVAVYVTMEFRGIFPKGSAPREAMKTLHYMLGFSVLLLVALRIVTRFSGPAPAILPRPPTAQDLLGRAMHVALYAFLILMPLIGWVMLCAQGKSVPFFGLEIPPLLGKDHRFAEKLEHWHREVGEWGYYLIGLHVAAALVHHYLMKDNTLLRMLPRRRGAAA
jgi:cytochrome b561